MSNNVSEESWFKHQWRPTTAWVYLAICLFDFLIAPILTAVYFAKYGGDYVAWKPISLSEGGLFHMAMGAILGITSWTRGQERISSARYRSEHSYRSDDRAPYRSTTETDFRDNLINDDR